MQNDECRMMNTRGNSPFPPFIIHHFSFFILPSYIMPKRRLLWIHQNFVSARQPGNSRPVQVISALLEQGWTVDLITTQTGYLHDDSQPLTRQEEVTVEREGELTIHRLRQDASLHSRGRSYVGFLRKTLRYVRRIGPVDMVFASTPPLPQVLLMAAVSVRTRAPLVLEIRDLWPG